MNGFDNSFNKSFSFITEVTLFFIITLSKLEKISYFALEIYFIA